MTLNFNCQVNGKQCGVAPSQDSDTLFVGNICKTWGKEDVGVLSPCCLCGFEVTPFQLIIRFCEFSYVGWLFFDFS
jgi:hypothetical protein